MPDTCMEIFNDRMFDIMNIVQRERQICYFLGDLNVDFLKHGSHQSTAAFLDSFYPYNVFPLITEPRGVTRESATLIDHVLMNNFDNNIQNMYTEFYVQAYLTIILLFLYNMIRFNNEMENVDWEFIKGNDNTQTAYSKFHNLPIENIIPVPHWEVLKMPIIPKSFGLQEHFENPSK